MKGYSNQELSMGILNYARSNKDSNTDDYEKVARWVAVYSERVNVYDRVMQSRKFLFRVGKGFVNTKTLQDIFQRATSSPNLNGIVEASEELDPTRDS